jgi:hypothetical protein
MMSAQGAHAEAEESWFVAFGPNDVRTLSLDQLDDAYRLDVINDETLVCSTTMNKWVPLGVVVGSDAPAPALTSASYGSSDALFGRTPYQQPAYSAPSYPPTSYAPATSSTSVMPHSMAPAVYDVGPAIQYQYPTGRSSRWGGVLMFLAFCSLGFAAFRLGAVSHLAGSVGMKQQLAAMTQRVLGTPGIETLEGVQLFIDRVSKEYRLDEIQVLGERLVGVSAIVGAAPATAPATPPVPAAVTAAEPAKAAPAATEAAALDINSLPRAETEQATAPAAVPAAAALSNTRPRAVATPVEPEEPKVTPGVLDTNAMRAALERSKKKAKKKDRYSKAAQFDPMNSTVE